MGVRVQLTTEQLQVRLSRWEKALGLLGDITVSLADIDDVHVIEDPVREAMGHGLKAGLRLPWLYYVCRTIRLDQAFVVRRGVPGICFSVHDGRPLKRVVVSTAEAHELASMLAKRAGERHR
jgi:hypothetical protein